MDNFTKRLVHLHHCRGIGWKTIYHILKIDPQLKSLYHHSFSDLILQKSATLTTLNDLHSDLIHEQIQQYSQNDIRIITIYDDEYPLLLKETYQPPWVIYAKGDISLLKKDNLLAVVGSREYTEYGENAINYLLPKLIEKGIVIVSGLAMGIDAIAHHTAIRNDGRTIGVIAGGLFNIYPKTNKDLAEEMMKNQLIISEYPPHTKPDKWQFPMRNRIISGISRGTLVVQAKRKSGSLITANFAVQEGREVFALPGSIFSAFSAGTNELIQLGAKLINVPEDILDEFIY
ncbi:DNA-processing protein DprA [Cytobacillus massiliigabonensis]|uniref:DNA-processing protein DprA n=1 Tax=Cytobacillus massiliigabonensis TaxID=1871011 RepID=UPI000C85A6CB|nr:DNA-processing protein DprA [Cytobacillus massiliigabonensis]